MHPCPNQMLTANPTPNCGAYSTLMAARQDFARGRVNHLAIEDAQEALDVVLGTFLVNTLQ
jgi:hypothetical protein